MAATPLAGIAGVSAAVEFNANFERKKAMWNKIKAWFKNSVTIFWARIQISAGLIGASVLALVSDPNVTTAIQSAMQPKFIPYYVIAIGLVTEIARRRSIGQVN
jgi:hypothetical protein